jgi:pyruvate/2-oxoacid:ferredoxin oxidoreductase alpha subunit
MGVRTFTATSSQGLALMHELLHWTSGARLPIVMANVNRALAPGWNIWSDQTDSLSQRDTGWIQLYCETAQEILDTTLLAFRLAESVNLPVMVLMDAFLLSHTYEPVDIPEQKDADAFLPPFRPRIELSTAAPCALSQMAPPNVYMEMRYSIQKAMEETSGRFDELDAEFLQQFGRGYGAVEAVSCEDADIVLVTSGTITGTARQVVRDMRTEGQNVGLLKIKLFRPFPAAMARQVLGSVRKVAVIDRNFSFGATGIFAQELRAALYGLSQRPTVFGFVAGLGGRDVTEDVIREIYRHTRDNAAPESEAIWMGLHEVSNGA